MHVFDQGFSTPTLEKKMIKKLIFAFLMLQCCLKDNMVVKITYDGNRYKWSLLLCNVVFLKGSYNSGTETLLILLKS